MGWSVTHADTTLERMEKNIFPWLGKRPLMEIEAPEILATLRRIESRGAIDTTHRIKALLSTVFRYAIATGRAERDPCRSVLQTGLYLGGRAQLVGHLQLPEQRQDDVLE